MISGIGAAEGALADFLRVATSGVVAGLEISCGVAISSSFVIQVKKMKTRHHDRRASDLCTYLRYHAALKK
jgi:hypothetical protein